jgi:DNA mismatch repair ATPase MutS
MNVAGTFDHATAGALDVAWLARELAPSGDYGRRALEGLRPFARGEETAARARAEAIVAVALALEDAELTALRAALRAIPDTADVLARLRVGEALADADLLVVARFCEGAIAASAQIAPAGRGADAATLDVLAAVERLLQPGRSRGAGFYLADAFASNLAAARSAYARAEATFEAARGACVARVGTALERDDVGGDEFIVMRSDLPSTLPPGLRVLREAPTYILCAVELDEIALRELGERDAAADAVAIAEERARASLATALAALLCGLDAAALWLGEIDLLAAAARYTRSNACVAAQYVDEACVDVADARFLPLERALAREGRVYTPISIRAGDAVVVTGPSMGGKTAALQACGAIVLYASLGLPVPARRARVGLFDRIGWLGVGVAGERDGLLSAFAGEVVRLREMLPRENERVLLLADEFARTTTPHEARALLQAIAQRLQQSGACGFIATHLDGIAAAAGVRHFAVRGLRRTPKPGRGDLRAALGALAEAMDYSLEEVGADAPLPADALALASLLGLDAELVESARRFLDADRRR